MGTNHSSRTILHPHNPAFNPDSRQCANLPVEVTTQGSLFNRLLKRLSSMRNRSQTIAAATACSAACARRCAAGAVTATEDHLPVTLSSKMAGSSFRNTDIFLRL